MPHLVTFKTKQPCTLKGSVISYFSGTMRQLTTQPLTDNAVFVRLGDQFIPKTDVMRIVEDKEAKKSERFSLTYMREIVVTEEVADLAYDGKTLFLETKDGTSSIFDATIIGVELV